MQLLEHQTVSRKTPKDGRLEISAAVASRLSALASEFPIESGGRSGTARLESITCTCAKRQGERHVHHFLEAPLLRELAPGSEVRVELEEARQALRVAPA